MLKCGGCGAEFEAPVMGKEFRGERFGEFCYEDMFYCPVCGSPDLTEGDVCSNCGGFFDVCSEITSTSRGALICKDCAGKLFTPELGIQYLESPLTAEEKNNTLNCFLDRCLPFAAFKPALLRGDDFFEVSGMQRVLKEFCMEDWRDFAEAVL